MTVSFDEQKIGAALQDFYNATGIDMDLLKADFSPADRYRPHNNRYCGLVQNAKAGKQACRKSDIALLSECKAKGEPCMHICHAGLMDVAIPIRYGDSIIGYIVFGRMRPDTAFSDVKRYLSQLGVDTEAAENAFCEIPFYNQEKINSVSHIATLLVKYILLENLLLPDSGEIAERAAAYILKNLENDLSIQSISRNTNISKSVLYKAFHDRYHCTVGSFINTKRVARSMELLLQTSLSVEQISQKVGFSSASYYSKIFKSQVGISPLQYRKNNGIHYTGG